MSKMKIRVHEEKKSEAQDVRLGDLNINNALDWHVSKDDRCVVITDEGNRRFKVALYDADNKLLDEETSTIYHAACYFRGTMEALDKKGSTTDGLVFYRD